MTIVPIEFLKKIIQIPSINPPGKEYPVAVELQNLFNFFGVENELVEVAPGRANLIALLRGRKTGGKHRVLGLSGHLDVVPPGRVPWLADPFSGYEASGKLYGRGTSDMKGGLVALAFAMIELQKEEVELAGDVRFLATAGEEVGSTGARELVAKGYMKDVTALLIAEPTYDEIVIAHKGALWVELTCYGKTAHGAMPHLGVNAIVHMNKIIQTIIEKIELKHIAHELLGHPTFNISMISGGVSTNVIPDECSIQIDFRTIPSLKHEWILQELGRLLAIVQSEIPDLRTEVRVTNDLPPVSTNLQEPFVGLVKQAVEQICGEHRIPRGVHFYTDAATLVSPGQEIPVVILGAGDDRLAHQPNEYIEIDRFIRSIAYYKLIIKKYLQYHMK